MHRFGDAYSRAPHRYGFATRLSPTSVARVCLGGTFDPFHRGHEALLLRAIKEAGADGAVFIGLVGDAFSSSKRSRPVRPLPERQATIEAWWADQPNAPTLAIRELTDKHGPSATGSYDVIVASTETAATARGVNQVRSGNHLPPLRVSIVPYVLGADLLPISATRMANGLISGQGTRLEPLVVAVGSKNPVKVEAVRRSFARWMPDIEIQATGVAVDTGVADQPWGDATRKGAQTRATSALDALPDAEYGVGLEAGLFEDSTGEILDVQHCVIVDRLGMQTHGHGGGFTYPPDTTEALRGTTKTVTDVLGPVAGDAALGATTGAVGWLTAGRLDRTRLSEQAVEAALVPRVRRDLYERA